MTSNHCNIFVTFVRVALCSTMVLAAGSSIDAAPYKFQGAGIVQLDSQGVTGETVTLSFVYDPSNWTLVTQADEFSRWRPPSPIPMNIVGSASGSSFQIHPVVSAELLNLGPTTDTAWQFSTGTPTASHGGLAKLYAPLKNSQLNVAVPPSFSAAHQIVQDELAAGNIWKTSPSSFSMGTEFSITPLKMDLLILQDFHWQVTQIPEPQTVCLASLAAAALTLQRRTTRGKSSRGSEMRK